MRTRDWKFFSFNANIGYLSCYANRLMPSPRRLSFSLLILRLFIGAFLIVWASLKFLRPEWMVNVFKGSYKLSWVTQDHAFIIGALQLLIVIIFILGLWRTVTYAFITLMHSAGVIATLLNGNLLFKGGLIKAVSTGVFKIGYINFPANLLWTSVTTLGALVALYILRHHDDYTIDGIRKRKNR